MTRRRHREHLDAPAIQALLEGELPTEELEAFEEHVASCAGCRSEVEAWRLLFSELGQMASLAPASEFVDGVMSRVDIPAPQAVRDVPQKAHSWTLVPWAARVRGWVARSTVGQHVSDTRLQDLADRALPAHAAARASEHLAACETCESSLFGWRAVMTALRSLPALAPSEGFADRVMARVRLRAATAARSRAGVLAWGRALRPRGARGWALVGGAVAAPSVLVGAVAYFVMAHPLLTAEYLLSYVWWRTSEALTALGVGIFDGLLETVTVFRTYAFVDLLATSPAALAAAATAFTILWAGALWVLYRNLLSAPEAVLRHVRA